MTPSQRREAVTRLAGVRRSENRLEVVEIRPSLPDWMETPFTSEPASARLVRDGLNAGGADEPRIVARSGVNPQDRGVISGGIPVLQTAVSLQGGEWLSVTQPQYVNAPLDEWARRVFLLLASIILAVLMVFLLLRMAGPLHELRLALERFGRQPEAEASLPERGAREIREAAQTFNRMRERIRGYLAERGRMLAAMAHDLRTPLTRAQLRAGKIEPVELRERFLADLEDVQRILNQGLELAGSLATEEEYVSLNLEAFLQSIVDDGTDENNDLAFKPLPRGMARPVIVTARPLCLKRCVSNLVSNALKYGGNAELSIARENGSILVLVEDSGPGIPEELLEQVFEPYFRLENSRNRAYGGTGLGLSIARNTAMLNDGALRLRNKPGGGLSARLSLRPDARAFCH
jgi:signal transduction histidine kinase